MSGREKDRRSGGDTWDSRDRDRSRDHDTRDRDTRDRDTRDRDPRDSARGDRERDRRPAAKDSYSRGPSRPDVTDRDSRSRRQR